MQTFIDHIISEKLLEVEEQRLKILKQFDLYKSFEINSFEN
jgi:hypothetical protein